MNIRIPPRVSRGSTDPITIEPNLCIPEPEEIAALVDRRRQKGDVEFVIMNSESHLNGPLIFIVKGPVEQLLDLFQTALAIETFPFMLGREAPDAARDAEYLSETRERVVFYPVPWSPRAQNMSHEEWVRRLAIKAAGALGSIARENFEHSIQDRLDTLADKRSFLGIQYDLSYQDLAVLHDFCAFWRQFEVKQGIFVILVKIATSSNPYWSRLSSWLSPSFRSTEPNVRHLEDLGNVFPRDVTEWWNVVRSKLSPDSALRADPVADVFVGRNEGRNGITMKEFRDRFCRMINAKISAANSSGQL